MIVHRVLESYDSFYEKMRHMERGPAGPECELGSHAATRRIANTPRSRSPKAAFAPGTSYSPVQQTEWKAWTFRDVKRNCRASRAWESTSSTSRRSPDREIFRKGLSQQCHGGKGAVAFLGHRAKVRHKGSSATGQRRRLREPAEKPHNRLYDALDISLHSRRSIPGRASPMIGF